MIKGVPVDVEPLRCSTEWPPNPHIDIFGLSASPRIYHQGVIEYLELDCCMRIRSTSIMTRYYPIFVCFFRDSPQLRPGDNLGLD